MLHHIAHRLLEDLNYAGAVAGPRDEILDFNRQFENYFYTPGPSGMPEPCKEFLDALVTTQDLEDLSETGRAVFISRHGQTFRLNVYFLNKRTGEEGLRLIIATPAEVPPDPPPFAEVAKRPAEPPSEQLAPEFSKLIGREPSFVQALLVAQRAAQTDLPVLILGESGTGKEILARTIHQASQRCSRSFVDVNCAAIPDSLVESELFGYEKGAFTGASPSGKAGFFENAHMGSIFMDEIGDAAAQTQAKLLRVLESGRFKRVGGNRNIRVDVRLISATNQELSHRIAEGRFRADLLYRINTITIKLHPLRERLEDLPLLVAHFLKKRDHGRRGKLRFSRDAMELLQAYSWPGNVRELKGVVDYAVTMASGALLTSKSLPSFLIRPPVPDESAGRHRDGTAAGPEPEGDLLAPVVERAEKRHIERVLERSASRSDAIRRLGISRRTFYTKLKQYGLD